MERPCSAQELAVREVPIPTVKPGWVLVRVRAFGINRSELFTRRGQSPSVKLPRIIGIECVGEVADPSDSGLQKGQPVVSLMGGLGRAFDGSYAEYALIPARQVYPVDTALDWVTLAAIPEMYYTAYASLFDALQLTANDTLLIRGGTSSVGLAALELAKSVGATVLATTRKREKLAFLEQRGADHALLDDGTLAQQILSICPRGVTKLLELVGTTTLKDSLPLVARHGILCMSGILGDAWELERFEPLEDIPTGVYFTAFTSERIDAQLLADMFHHIEHHQLKVPIARTFPLDQIAQAHQLMESNTANGKIVIVNRGDEVEGA